MTNVIFNFFFLWWSVNFFICLFVWINYSGKKKWKILDYSELVWNVRTHPVLMELLFFFTLSGREWKIFTWKKKIFWKLPRNKDWKNLITHVCVCMRSYILENGQKKCDVWLSVVQNVCVCVCVWLNFRNWLFIIHFHFSLHLCSSSEFHIFSFFFPICCWW